MDKVYFHDFVVHRYLRKLQVVVLLMPLSQASLADEIF